MKIHTLGFLSTAIIIQCIDTGKQSPTTANIASHLFILKQSEKCEKGFSVAVLC